MTENGEEDEKTIPYDEKMDMAACSNRFVFRRFSCHSRLSDEAFDQGGQL